MGNTRKAAYLFIAAGCCFAVVALLKLWKQHGSEDLFISGMDAVAALLFFANAVIRFRRTKRSGES